MIIVNSYENIPVTIITTCLKKLHFINKEFLDTLTKPQYKQGVKRDNYYVVKTENFLRYPQYNRMFVNFSQLCEMCYMRGYQLLMIKINENDIPGA